MSASVTRGTLTAPHEGLGDVHGRLDEPLAETDRTP